MNENPPHAKAFDLPGWPCPPRARDIPNHKCSWGWIPTFQLPATGTIPVAQDEQGYLWVNGNTVPEFREPNEADANPGALVFWSETGIGLWVHPKSLRYLLSINRNDMSQDDWLPVNEVARDIPSFIK